MVVVRVFSKDLLMLELKVWICYDFQLVSKTSPIISREESNFRLECEKKVVNSSRVD